MSLFSAFLDFIPVVENFVYSNNTTLCARITVDDSDFTEATEFFFLLLSTSDEAVSLSPKNTTVTIINFIPPDSVNDTFNELKNISATGEQTADNIQLLTDTLVGLVNSITTSNVTFDQYEVSII